MWEYVAEGGRNMLRDVGCTNVVFCRGAENQSDADNRSWKRSEKAASLLDVSVGRHSALAKPSFR